ncbi:uncharacterized protein LOC123559443 isoform X2 [Mercenaria mercenaria]|uniref:uncharacterized protein LOC123559443 isoform X2 n=1 Tax=Mercenaria mercenaria TaxID=6596 RepID=UPI00234F2292|nr:uncharacterized protein LOC123559443 isoform X2 [Mercenaria mercenaria]
MSKNVLLLGILTTVLGQGTFYVPSNKSYWADYGKECVPATPKVDAAISNSSNVYDVDNLIIDLPDNEDVWVGYYQVVRVFEYIGCVEHRSFFAIDPQFIKIKGDPGHCFPGCSESTIIGVTKTRCYCLGDVYNLTKHTQAWCTDKCNNPAVACGQDRAPVKYSYISIYKINPHVTASSIQPVKLTSPGNRDCLHLDPNVPKTFYWDICTFSRKAMCFYDGRVENVRCKGTSEYCSWIDAANTCFHNGRFPTLYSNSKDVMKGTKAQLWTGLFKTNVVYKYNANIPEERRHDKKQLGYLTKEGNTSVKLRFAEADSMKRLLCVQAGDNYGIYIAVGVSVSVILIAVAIVLLICFVRRRRKTASQECSRSHNNTTYQTTETDNDNLELAMPNESQSRNDYFILEPGRKEHDNISVTYDTATEDTVYDTTDVRQDSVTAKSENVYNKLDTDKDTTYDKAFAGSGPKSAFPNDKVIDDAGMYDSSTVANKPICFDGQADSIYNKSDDMDDGEYHHLGGNVKQSKTDNIYGIQGTKSKDQALCDDDSTYNCITNDSTETVKTDDTYSSFGAK